MIITLGLLALALGISLILRAKIPAIRRMMMPTAVLAGFILLFFKEVHLIELNTDILEMLVYHTIAMGFIAMSLRKALRPKGNDGKRTGQLTGLKSGAIIVGTYLVQAFVGLAISMTLASFMPRVFQASGLLLPMGFGQGPGQANNIGSTYESMGFEGGRSYGLAIAAAGYLCACTVGVLILHRWSRRPLPSTYRKSEYLPAESGVSMFQAPNEIPVSDSIDRFSVQFILVLGVYLLTYLVTYGLTSLITAISPGLGNTVNTLLWGFNFIIGSALAMLVGKVLDKLHDLGVSKRQYRNNYLLNRLSGLFFDLCTTGPIGLMALLTTVASYLLGMEVRNKIATDGFRTIVDFAIAAFAVSLVYHLMMIVLGDGVSVFDALFLRTLPTVLLTVIAYLPFVLILSHRDGGGSSFGGAHSNKRLR